MNGKLFPDLTAMRSLKKLLAILIGTLFGISTLAYAESAQVQLDQLVAQLQKSPDDSSLREKIIKAALKVRPAPVLPEEAERRMVRGTEAFKAAKSISDYQSAAQEFEQAALAAPWSGDVYFNLGLAQDKAEDYERSLRSLKFAQLALPASKDIKDLYFKVEYQRDKSLQANVQGVATDGAQKSQDSSSVIGPLNGTTWNVAKTAFDGYKTQWKAVIAIAGDSITISSPTGERFIQGKIVGNDFSSINWSVSPPDPGNSPAAIAGERFMKDYAVDVTIDRSAHQINWKTPAIDAFSNAPDWSWSRDTFNYYELTR